MDAALLAAYGTGLASANDVRRRWVTLAARATPEPPANARYQRAFAYESTSSRTESDDARSARAAVRPRGRSGVEIVTPAYGTDRYPPFLTVRTRSAGIAAITFAPATQSTK